MSLVEVRNLRIELTGSGADIVDEISFDIEAGEVLGLVGESGSGKTTIGVALLGDARRGARIARGSIRIDSIEVLPLTRDELQAFRGLVASYVPQDPAAALNPALRLDKQLYELFQVHQPALPRKAAQERIQQTLTEVSLPTDAQFLRRFPHELSGGQQQRICIAMAFMLRPKVLVLDEPTTGLDVSTQTHVLKTLRELCRGYGVATLYVTHDLAVVANLAHRVMVLYAGRLAELANRKRLFSHPAHPYTRKLLAAIPDVVRRHPLNAIQGTAPMPGYRPSGCFFNPRCSHAVTACKEIEPEIVELVPRHLVRCLRVCELGEPANQSDSQSRQTVHNDADVLLSASRINASYGNQNVVHEVSLELRSGECVALVGQSGSGKTTLARVLIGLHHQHSGELLFKGRPLEARSRDRPAEARREIQFIFQSPHNSLNPRRLIGDIVGLPLEYYFALKRYEARELVVDAVQRVALSPDIVSRYPGDLSGGELQRVAIARALVCRPKLLICDEVTSALDVSVQAAIVQLLRKLQVEDEIAVFFVTHNLALVRSIADRVLVMNGGKVIEMGETDRILDRPEHLYTSQLISDTPSLYGDLKTS